MYPNLSFLTSTILQIDAAARRVYVSHGTEVKVLDAGTDAVIGTLSTVFAFLAIVISCLGLLGLSFFSIEQRTKEEQRYRSGQPLMR